MATLSSLQIPVTGYEVIDNYHRRLADTMSEAAVLASSSDYSRFLVKVHQFRKYTASHFAQEEVIMRGIGYQSVAQHHTRHDEILADIDRALGSLEGAAGGGNRFAVLKDLERLLFDHEIHYDTDFHDFYERLGGTSAGWTGDLLVGIDWVDAQHRDLFDQLQAVDQASKDGLAQNTIRALLDRFVAAVRRHFAQEEADLARRGGGAVSEHRTLHRQNLSELEDLLTAFDEDVYAVLSTDYLKFWLVDHIRRVDKADFAHV
jgi:hemerythrin